MLCASLRSGVGVPSERIATDIAIDLGSKNSDSWEITKRKVVTPWGLNVLPPLLTRETDRRSWTEDDVGGNLYVNSPI